MSDVDTILEWALRFARSGYYVFPFYASHKGPMKPYGWARNASEEAAEKIIPASKDEKFILSWPERVASGYKSEVVGYGVMGIDCIIFDLDVKDGKDGIGEFNKLRKEWGFPAPEILVKSKSGGLHLYYGKSKAFKANTIKSVANVIVAGVKYTGVDVRGDGGMVVGPTSECAEEDWQPGQYSIIRGYPEAELSFCPDSVVVALSRISTSDAESMIVGPKEEQSDVMSVLRRGEIPDVLPLGERNNGFFAFLTALKNKGFSKETAKQYAKQLIAVTEESHTLHESVDVDAMIDRIWTVSIANPYDVARDLLNLGLMRLTDHTTKIKYIIMEPNPYIVSTSPHDLASMKQLLGRFSKTVVDVKGKDKLVNPADLLDKIIEPENEAANLGFKPGDGKIFTLTGRGLGRRYLNTWRDPRSNITEHYDVRYWELFKELVGRIFGPPGSEEYDLGLDFPAWILQKPGLKPVITPYIMSRRRGVGKSLYLDMLQQIFGHSKLGDSQAKPYKVEDITGRFFDPSGSSILMFDEVQFPLHKDMRKESTTFWKHLKNLVTVGTMPVEIKGGGVIQVPTLAGMILSGNQGANFPMEEYDRRVWIIDNNPPDLETGTFDDFFALCKGQASVQMQHTIVSTILKELNQHKIRLMLDRIRAPMTEVKMEMMRNGMTDVEEWWQDFFATPTNPLAITSVVSKSAIMYVLENFAQHIMEKKRDNAESLFRDLRRRGCFLSIKNNRGATRQINNIMNVTTMGTVEGSHREVMFTTKNHGKYDYETDDLIVKDYMVNLHTLKNYMEQKRGAISAKQLISP